MKKFIVLLAALSCEPGDEMVDFASVAAGHVNSADVIVQIFPLEAHVVVYPPGHFDEGQKCCFGKPNWPLTIRMPDRKLCVRKSQDRVRWHIFFKGETNL